MSREAEKRHFVRLMTEHNLTRTYLGDGSGPYYQEEELIKLLDAYDIWNVIETDRLVQNLKKSKRKMSL